MQRPRILEIGPFCLFKQAWPDTTEYLFAGPSRFALPDGLPERFRRRRWKEANGFDLIVAHTAAESSWKPEVLGRLLSRRRFADGLAALSWDIARQYPPGIKAPLVVLDMHDERTIQASDIALLRASTLYFKRELPANAQSAFPPNLRSAELDGLVERIRPISLGLSADVVRDSPTQLPPKSIDIFFAGHLRHAPFIRNTGLKQLQALSAEGVLVDIAETRLSRPDFLARCARASLVWSPEGLGWDCFRHYEAALCGSVPLINLPSIRRHEPLRDGEHALYYSVEDDGLRQTILAALKQPARLADMGRAGRDHVLKHHTHEAICEYVVRECLMASPASL